MELIAYKLLLTKINKFEKTVLCHVFMNGIRLNNVYNIFRNANKINN